MTVDERGPADRPRVLVIEDIEINRDLLQQLLEDDYEVRSEVDGESGLAAVDAWRPDIVLLDLSLPKLDGWSVARAIRRDPELQDMRVVALTAHAMRGDRENALAAGCDAYLSKPVDETELYAVLKNLAARDR